jgi:hypothetical protein
MMDAYELRAKLTKTIGNVLTSAHAAQLMAEDMGDDVEFHNHEGNDDYVDFEFEGRGFRLQIQGPFD